MIIGLIDDVRGFAESVVNNVSMWLESQKINETTIVYHYPDKDINDSISWIVNEPVSVLILDERLGINQESQVDYKGHDLVQLVRSRIPDLPIYILTDFQNDDCLVNTQDSIEFIISKDKFLSEQMNVWFNRFMRSGNRFYQNRKEVFCELTMLAEKIAIGEADDDDKQRIASLREEICIAHWSETLNNKSSLLNELNEVNQKAYNLITKLNEIIKNED